jgi:ArsR family transcriptional regulator
MEHTSAFEALADGTRREILKQLRSGSRTAGEIAEAFDLSKPTLSHHFKVLRSAGLIRAERRGTSIVYSLQANALEELALELMGLVDGIDRATRKKKGAASK